MTVGTTPSRVRYAGDGTTTDFPVPFAFIAPEDLQVVERAVAGGAETVLALGSDFTVGGGGGAAGTVHAAAAPGAAVEWVIRRATARAQEVDYTANDPFPAETHERALDRLTMIAQEQDEALARVPALPVSSSLTALTLPEPAPGRGFKWNATADALVTTSLDPDQAQTEAGASAAASADSATAAAGSATTAVASAAAAASAETSAEAAQAAAEAAAAAAQAVANGVITTRGDLVVGNAAGDAVRLALGAAGTSPVSDGSDLVQSRPHMTGGNVLAPHEGLVVKRTGNATVDVDAGAILLRTTTGLSHRAEGVDLTLNIASSGANGLDAGTEAASTWYYIWVIFNGSAVAGLLSTSPASPTLPSGYTYKALVGAIFNDGSSNLEKMAQRGDTARCPAKNALLGGSQTAFTAISLATCVPANASFVIFSLWLYTSSGSASVTGVISSDGATTTPASDEAVFRCPGVTTATVFQGDCILTIAQQIEYYLTGTNARADLQVIGWKF